MSETVTGAFFLAAYLAPFGAYAWAVRRSEPTVGSVVRASALAGLCGGVCYLLLVALLLRPAPQVLIGFVPWAIILTGWGTFVGIAGVAARYLGRSWSTRL
jgi:hypothetical protein